MSHASVFIERLGIASFVMLLLLSIAGFVVELSGVMVSVVTVLAVFLSVFMGFYDYLKIKGGD